MSCWLENLQKLNSRYDKNNCSRWIIHVEIVIRNQPFQKWNDSNFVSVTGTLTLSTPQNFLFFKMSFFLVETIGEVWILLHTHFVRKTNLQCQVCRKTMIKWFLLTTWDKNSLIFSANWAEPGSQRKIKKNPDYQFQQGNCLLELVIKIFFLREKLILKNKKFSCVEGVIKLGLFRSKI